MQSTKKGKPRQRNALAKDGSRIVEVLLYSHNQASNGATLETAKDNDPPRTRWRRNINKKKKLSIRSTDFTEGRNKKKKEQCTHLFHLYHSHQSERGGKKKKRRRRILSKSKNNNSQGERESLEFQYNLHS